MPELLSLRAATSAAPRPRGEARRRFLQKRGRAALLWALAVFVGAQVGFHFLMEFHNPELRDPEYGVKLTRLRALQAANPGRPLLLVLGSSRVNMGLRPDCFPAAHSPHGDEPLVYNLAINGAGPLSQLIYYHRLRADGIRPDWIVFEVLTPVFNQEGDWTDEKYFEISRAGWRDMHLLQH